MQKTGAVEETHDADFDLLAAEFEKQSRTTERLVADIAKYSETVESVMAHQEDLLACFCEIVDEREKDALVLLERIRNTQRDLSTQTSDLHYSESLLKEIIQINQTIAAKITKRNHKLLDYDRHRHAVEKSHSTANQRTRSLGEERKLAKSETSALDAHGEYERYNEMLKVDIPRYLLLTGKLLQPVISSLGRFQRAFYQQQWDIFSSINLGWQKGKCNKLSCAEILSRHEETMGSVMCQLEEIPMIQLAGGRMRKGLGKDVKRPEDEGLTSRSPREVPVRSLTPTWEKPPVSATREAPSLAPTVEKPPLEAVSKRRVAGLAAHLDSTHITSTPTIPKRSLAPPPPLPSKKNLVTALYDFSGCQQGDLSFVAGDLIEIVKRTETRDDWWTGRLKGVTGVFPANYVTEYP